jgi:CubicO group peptidase (beta-lactamase class C family)
MKTAIFICRLWMAMAGFGLLLGNNCFAQNAAAAAGKVDDFIKSEMQKQRIPGLSLAIVKDDKIILAKGYGLANVELAVPVKPETIFQSGSVGKQFTATAVMILVEEGKINLDDKLNKYFADAPEAWKNITVRHLLTHTSGLPNDFSEEDYRRDFTEAEMVKKAETFPLEFQPGEKWSYSNVGYKLLGVLIGKVTGKFYGDFLQERIFKPLGMTTARIISEADIVPNRAAGYQIVKDELKNQTWVSPTMNTTADGSLYLTVYDMAKWDAALYTEKLLKKSSLEQMWTPVKLNDGKTYPYGFGWALGEVGGHPIVEHGGAWQGFKSFIVRYPNDRLTVIVFANLAETNPATLAHGVAGIYNAELIAPPIAGIEDKEPRVTELLKDTLRKFIDGTIKPDVFTPEMSAGIFPDVAKQIGVTLKSFGPLESVVLLSRTEQNGSRIYHYRLKYPAVNALIKLTLTKGDKIAGMSLEGED